MSEAALEAVLRRDRIVVLAALVALIALAGGYTAWLAGDMARMRMDFPGAASSMRDMNGASLSEEAKGRPPMDDMGGSQPMAMAPVEPAVKTPGIASALTPSFAAWSGAHFIFMFAMWAVMMTGMMAPSATPMILLYARIGRQAAAQRQPFAATGFFAGGYLLAWIVFSFFATCAQWLLERAALLTPMMASASAVFGGLVLIAAGLFQWTSLKAACLDHCRTPLAFIQHHGGFRRDSCGALGLGLRHGLYCIGCCWALMLLLFVGGVMNIFWIVMLALFVLLEKLVAGGRILSRAAGAGLTAWGVWLLASALA